MIGSNQKYFITLGTYWVRSYFVKANGAIGAQVSQINTQNYNGNECGRTNGAVLDHSGQYLYALLNVPLDGYNLCDAFQTFKIAGPASSRLMERPRRTTTRRRSGICRRSSRTTNMRTPSITSGTSPRTMASIFIPSAKVHSAGGTMARWSIETSTGASPLLMTTMTVMSGSRCR